MYKHCKGIYYYKTDYFKTFTLSPMYSLIFNQLLSHDYDYKFNNIDDRAAMTGLYENFDQAYRENLFIIAYYNLFGKNVSQKFGSPN